jgi:hypothetical protein
MANIRAEREGGNRDRDRGCHEPPGEWERIGFHSHQYEHDCYGRHCPEADRLYAAWQAALKQSR